jgi:hypothetical protein
MEKSKLFNKRSIRELTDQDLLIEMMFLPATYCLFPGFPKLDPLFQDVMESGKILKEAYLNEIIIGNHDTLYKKEARQVLETKYEKFMQILTDIEAEIDQAKRN